MTKGGQGIQQEMTKHDKAWKGGGVVIIFVYLYYICIDSYIINC